MEKVQNNQLEEEQNEISACTNHKKLWSFVQKTQWKWGAKYSMLLCIIWIAPLCTDSNLELLHQFMHIPVSQGI